MNCLAFDCSTSAMAVALQTDSGVSLRLESGGMRHAELLLPSVESLLANSGIGPADLDLIVCGKGPGSFTGIRIALSSAKGLSSGSGVPLVSVPSLDWLAAPFSDRPGLVVPVIDARKGRLYAAAYSRGKRAGEYLDLSAADLAARLPAEEEVFFTGPDADLLSETAAERPGWDIDPFYRCPRPECLLALGVAAFEERGPDGPADSPLYVRESEADIGIQPGSGRGD